MNVNYNEIGQRIRTRRKQLGMTQKRLAELVELSEGSVSRYESGSIKDAPTTKLNDFAKALNVEVSWIIGFKPATDKFKIINDCMNELQELNDAECEEVIEILKKIMKLAKGNQ